MIDVLTSLVAVHGSFLSSLNIHSKSNLAVPELHWILPLPRFSKVDSSLTPTTSKRHILLMNTTRYIDRLNDSSTHFLTKQLSSVNFYHQPSSNRTTQSLFAL